MKRSRCELGTPLSLLAFLSLFTVLPVLACAAGGMATDSVSYRLFGLNFSPYVAGQDPNNGDVVSEAQLRARMEIVAPYTEWIRCFGSSNGLELCGEVAHSLGLLVVTSAWLGRDLRANEQEITTLIDRAGMGHADMVVVGSEVLLRRDLTEAQLLGYIARVQEALPDIPVTTADVYSELLAHPAVLKAVDVVFANYYPYWEGIHLNSAVAALHQYHQSVREAAQGKEVFVSETGWPSCGEHIGNAVPSPDNASFYFRNFISWARANNVRYLYFSAFDEAWKAQYEGPQGACWGLWDQEGVLKPGMHAVFDGETIPDNWSGNEIPCGPGEPSIAVTVVPSLNSIDNLVGQVCHVEPTEYKVVVYIKVRGSWWIKPFFSAPLTAIKIDGSWITDITTGGVDQEATHVIAYLVPGGYAPPLIGGRPILPAELDQHAVAKVEALRQPPQPSCHQFDASQPVLEPWGVAYNVFSEEQEVLLHAFCGDPNSTIVVIGNGNEAGASEPFDGLTYAYHHGHYWNGVRWVWFPLYCAGFDTTKAASVWCKGRAVGFLPRSIQWFIGRTCVWWDGEYRCGCTDASCTQSFWQLQEVKR